jgi:hypothetical protein
LVVGVGVLDAFLEDDLAGAGEGGEEEGREEDAVHRANCHGLLSL